MAVSSSLLMCLFRGRLKRDEGGAGLFASHPGIFEKLLCGDLCALGYFISVRVTGPSSE